MRLATASSVESVYEPVHLGVAWTSPVDVEERMMLTRRGVKLVWTQVGYIQIRRERERETERETETERERERDVEDAHGARRT